VNKRLKIKKAAVIGSGVMGAGIAAHLANCGIRTLLLDIVPSELSEEDKKNGLEMSSPEFRSKLALQAIKEMPKARLNPLYDPADVDLIEAGNLDDDFERLADVDWIIEVVVERPDIKRQLFERLESVHSDGQIVSSNTSGISLETILEGRGQQFREHALITHFFNPPRYMHLLELIPGADTRPELFEAMKVFGARVLGKGTVVCKDTPSFVANRIGGFDISLALALAQELGLSVEETDAVSSPLIGRPKTGVFRMLDMVGLDTVDHVNRRLYEAVPNDESRDVFRPNPLIEKLVERGSLGAKSGEGFYKKTKDENGKTAILALDMESLKYGPSVRPSVPVLRNAKKTEDMGERLRYLIGQDDKYGQYVWQLLSSTLCYAANRIPEIADDIGSVDNAVCWGYGWTLGPFALWDAIGVRLVVDRMQSEGRQVPGWITEMLASGRESFYGFEDGENTQYDVVAADKKTMPRAPWILTTKDQCLKGKTVKDGKTASLVDLDDGVLCIELHSKVNAIGPEVVEMIQAGIGEAETNYQALVITGQGPNFSVGADLSGAMGEIGQGNWNVIEDMLTNFQNATTSLTYAQVPTVAAVQGRALGGGCEISVHCDRIQTTCELYIGLVEVGVGLVPAGGGCREMAVRCAETADNHGGANLMPYTNAAVELIGMAKVSTGGVNARQLGYLRQCDGISRNHRSLLKDAKMVALGLAEQGYRPPRHRTALRVLGEAGIAEFRVRLGIFRQGGYISEYDEYVANKVAYILCGGPLPKDSKVDEQHILDLEREAFLSLLGEEKTIARIMHTLTTGKPLRN
jgi:3-hydroxyacyl-CoA dehydrogenase